jgi:hypothetical protein
MNLPRKDKDGNSYLSYSQIALFKRDKQEYKESYIIGKPFEGNDYTDFGSKVGEALEHNNFDLFDKKESDVLKTCRRLDLFERETKLEYDKDGFYVKGFIDTINNKLTNIIDYKTGGRNKEFQYKELDYVQIQLYALSIMQETGIKPDFGSVEFIRRSGNAFRGEKLTVANEKPIQIEIDISLDRLKQVYWSVLRTAKEIEQFYKENK